MKEINVATIHHQVSVNAAVEKVYEAISTAEGISTWWDKQTPVQTEQGLVLEHNPGPEHGVVRFRVVELIPNKRIEWECISTHPATSPASAWTGTHFTFDLSENNSRTIIDFRQLGYDDQSEFFKSNEAAWLGVLENLKQVLESQGQ